MREATEILVSIDEKRFNIDFPILRKELTEMMIGSLKAYVEKGFPIKLTVGYVDSLLDTIPPDGKPKITSRVIFDGKVVDQWKDEIKQLISVLDRGKRK